MTDANISNAVSFLDNSTIIFSSQQEAAMLLGTSDEYSQKLSLFDIKSKTQNINSSNESDYLQYAASQAQSWTNSEIEEIKVIVASVEKQIKSLGLNFELPFEIKLVKSSLEEEGGALGYTRSNYIVLRHISEEIFTHELFHVYSRSNPDKRDKLYTTINFEKCNPVTLPDVIKDNEISNPDAPVLEHFLKVQIDGEQKEVMFIIYSEEPYSGGSFVNYLDQKLMVIEGDNDSKMPVLNNNYPILKDFSSADNLNELIGNNTSYNIHPEEVLAEHFTLLILQKSVPDSFFLEQIKELLK